MMNYHDEVTYAVMNTGRWIARCPECARKGMNVAAEVKPGEDFICPFENPGIVANMAVAVDLTPKEKRDHKRLGVESKFRVRGVPDMEEREKAKAEAVRYKVIWPKEKKEIEALLRMRPATAMNWDPGQGETVEFLKAENLQYGVRAPSPRGAGRQMQTGEHRPLRTA